MAKHTFKPGDRVAVLNANMRGMLIVEGTATVVSLLDGDEFYDVRFDDSRSTYERKVNPDAQGDPQAYVNKVNQLSTASNPSNQ